MASYDYFCAVQRTGFFTHGIGLHDGKVANENRKTELAAIRLIKNVVGYTGQPISVARAMVTSLTQLSYQHRYESTHFEKVVEHLKQDSLMNSTVFDVERCLTAMVQQRVVEEKPLAGLSP